MMKFLLFSCAFLLSSSGILLAEKGGSPFLPQTQIKGLLVYDIGDGALASKASQMNATLVPAKKGKKFTIGFNQKVGKQMTAATREVEKFIRLRYSKKVPAARRIEFAFENKHNPKDGPSAAVVCALMADSILSGQKIDPGFAATGDMTATGAVMPVGGVADKIRGAIKRKCKLVAIPEQNQKSVSDKYLMEGLESLYKIQIFTLKTFEDASAIASQERQPDMAKAIEQFAMVQDVLSKNESYINNGKVIEKLRMVNQLAPNHLSARILLLHGLGRGPTKLSLSGSLDSIEEASARLNSMLVDKSYRNTGGNSDVLSRLINDLNIQRPQLDRRTWRYADANRELAEFAMGMRGKKFWNSQHERECNEAINRIKAEANQLTSDPEIMEELENS